MTEVYITALRAFKRSFHGDDNVEYFAGENYALPKAVAMHRVKIGDAKLLEPDKIEADPIKRKKKKKETGNVQHQ